MSKKTVFSVLAAGCVLAVIGLIAILPAEGAKPANPASALSLKASFEELWVEGENLYRIQNDFYSLPYVDTPDQKVGKKTVKSGVEVKYYPTSGYHKNGCFTMTIDQSGSLQRFVLLHFLEPSADPAYENESKFPGLHVDPLWGGTGTLLTSKISFTSWAPLKADEEGILRWDTDSSLDMEKMQAGESKFISLRIEFNPQGEFIDRTYNLGEMPLVNYRFGMAELHCVEAGQEWEIRPFTETFTNEPDNSWRLLHTDVQLDRLRNIKLRLWHMPFVLKLSK